MTMHEHTVGRIGRELEARLAACADRVRSASGVQVSKVMNSEDLDRLRLAVLEDLEVVLRQSFDDPAVLAGGIGVDADVVRAGAEDRRPLGLRLRRSAQRRDKAATIAQHSSDRSVMQRTARLQAGLARLRT